MPLTTIATVGSINTDLAINAPRAPLTGENLRAERLTIGQGGKGANCAGAIARMGAHSLLVGCVGDDAFGQRALRTLTDAGVDTAGVQVDAESSSGVAVIIIDRHGENTILVVPGANDKLSEQQVAQALAPHWQSLGAVVVNLEVPDACVAAATQLARDHGVPCVVDAGPPREAPVEAWRAALVLTPNAAEAATLLATPVDPTRDDELRRAAQALRAQGPEVVVVKLGARGAWLSAPTYEGLVPAFDVPVVDTTGAGDASTAALALAITQRRPWLEAVRFANAAGALAVTRLGTFAAMPTMEEIEALLARG